jgi:hypothetical protein
MESQALNSGLPSIRSPVAQLVEQAAVNRLVAGSSPARGATLETRLDRESPAPRIHKLGLETGREREA